MDGVSLNRKGVFSLGGGGKKKQTRIAVQGLGEKPGGTPEFDLFGLEGDQFFLLTCWPALCALPAHKSHGEGGTFGDIKQQITRDGLGINLPTQPQHPCMGLWAETPQGCSAAPAMGAPQWKMLPVPGGEDKRDPSA